MEPATVDKDGCLFHKRRCTLRVGFNIEIGGEGGLSYDIACGGDGCLFHKHRTLRHAPQSEREHCGMDPGERKMEKHLARLALLGSLGALLL